MKNLITKFRGLTLGIPCAPAGYISETYTSGLEVGTPFAYGLGGKLIKADQANKIPAVGVIVKADPVPAGSEYEDNAVAKALPHSLGGSIHDEEKLAIFTIQSGLQFRTVDEVVATTGAGTTETTTLTVAGVDLTATLKVGDYIVVTQSTKTTTVTQIAGISFTTDTTITTADKLKDTYTAGTITAKSMKGKPVYIGDTSGTSKFSKLDIPYTTLAPRAGEWGQEAGYIYSSVEIKVNLEKDLVGKTY